MESSTLSHSDLVAAVANWRDNGKRLIWTETGIGSAWLTGGHGIPDVYTMECSYAPKPTAYECKVSRSDFYSDITKGKWRKYLRTTTRLYFVAPRGLIDKHEVPAECGLITWEPGTENWRTVKRATVRECELKHNDWMSLLLAGHEERVRVRNARERIRAIENAGLLPERRRLAREVQQKLNSLDRLLSEARRDRDNAARQEELASAAKWKAEEQLRKAQQDAATPTADLLLDLSRVLRWKPEDVEDFLRMRVRTAQRVCGDGVIDHD